MTAIDQLQVVQDRSGAERRQRPMRVGVVGVERRRQQDRGRDVRTRLRVETVLVRMVVMLDWPSGHLELVTMHHVTQKVILMLLLLQLVLL